MSADEKMAELIRRSVEAGRHDLSPMGFNGPVNWTNPVLVYRFPPMPRLPWPVWPQTPITPAQSSEG